MKSVRILLGALALAAGILAVSYMQAKFDQGDLRKAVAAVQARFPDVTGCTGHVRSRARGNVMVSCRDRDFLVDVVSGIIQDAPPP